MLRCFGVGRAVRLLFPLFVFQVLVHARFDLRKRRAGNDRIQQIAFGFFVVNFFDFKQARLHVGVLLRDFLQGRAQLE